MRLDLRLLGLALLLPVGVAQASAHTDYAYAFPLDTRMPSDAYRVALTPAIYAVSNPAAGMRDIVVVNSDGQPVPFDVMPVDPPQTKPLDVKTSLLPVPPSHDVSQGVRVQRNGNGDIIIDHTNEQAGGSAKPTQWLIDAGRSAGVDTINVAPESIKQDFDIHVQVDSSDDLKTWSPRGDIQSLTRVSSTKDDDGGGDHVEQLSLSVAGDQPARYYRVRLVDGDVDWRAGQTPAVRLEGSYVLASADPLASLQWMNVPVDGSPKRGNDFDYKLSAPLPLESARLVLPAGNVAAHITVSLGTLESDGKLAWSSVGSVDAVRVKGSNEPTSLQWTMQTTQYLRVHADTALANAPALQVGWMPETYMFMAEGQGPYRLLAGSYEATRGSYPIAASLEKLRKAKGDDHWLPPVAAVGNRVDEAGPGALKPPKVPYDWTRPVLWVVLILGALLIAGMAWSLLKSPRDTQPGA